MKILYFAALRERVGRNEEDIALPDDVLTISDLIAFLSNRDDDFAAALETPARIRSAIDARIVPHDTAIGDAEVVALFPPMTGG